MRESPVLLPMRIRTQPFMTTPECTLVMAMPP